MTDKVNLSKLWESINSNSISHSKEIVERNVDALVEFLINKTLEHEKFDIGLFEEGRQSGSTLAYKEVAGQKEIELRLKQNSAYDIILTLVDNEDEIYVLKNKLNSDEIKLIPETIQSLMYKVREIERPMTFFNTLAE